MAEEFSFKSMANDVAEDAVNGATAVFQSEFQDYSKRGFAESAGRASAQADEAATTSSTTPENNNVAKPSDETPKTSISERTVCGVGLAAWGLLATDIAKNSRLPVVLKSVPIGLAFAYAYVCKDAVKDTAVSIKDTVIGK
ncbi:MAG: hypothetical protein K2X77_16425 [Candidatus Obscuribacterales bacterium]|jgi:hypothetical protein|nr:hypothetical protein [Candidatus Obscuribacterales bacterium]